jgi:hypothetical protein
MFGFFKPLQRSKEYRRLYCDSCVHLQANYGISSAAFLSYEAVLLHALASDLNLLTIKDTPTPCGIIPSPKKLKASLGRVHKQIGEFSSAFTHLLLKTKLEDDVQDDKSLLAKFLMWCKNRRFKKCLHYFEMLEPNFKATLANLLETHRQSEQKRQPLDLVEYAVPTSKAFGYVFSLFAQTMNLPEKIETLRKLGSHVGATILYADCGYDWERDKRKGLYNPVQSTEESAAAFILAQTALRQGITLLREEIGNNTVTEKIFTGVHDRLYRSVQDNRQYKQYLTPLKECLSISDPVETTNKPITSFALLCPEITLLAEQVSEEHCCDYYVNQCIYHYFCCLAPVVGILWCGWTCGTNCGDSCSCNCD